MIEFEILGKPLGKARPRVTRKGFTYTPQKTVNYESLIRYTFQSELPNHKPYEGYVEAEIKAIFDIPKSYSKKKKLELLDGNCNYDHTPDVDNVAKIVLDSLNGIAYKDDSQVTILKVIKEYGEQAKIIVKLKEIS